MHHTGIKTQFLKAVLPNPGDFNCTIQELKRIGERESYLLYHISIAPYRN
ncbi:hypothetical protein HMPREF1322_2078 [Porphyromonas gingivalis W50]|nr:hypothetical protein HMPREF1322_2078 [Porphyromonas gingivalis W50]